MEKHVVGPLDSQIQRRATSAHGCVHVFLQTHTHTCGDNGQGLPGWSSCALGYRFLLITLVSAGEGASFLLLEFDCRGGGWLRAPLAESASEERLTPLLLPLPLPRQWF